MQHTFDCPSCGQTVAGKRRDAKYCSPRCAYAASTRRCSRQGCTNIFRAKGLCNTHYNAEYFPGSQKLWPANPETRRKALRKKTQRRRALQSLPTADHVDRDVVGERDKWKCGICRSKVDRSLVWPDPMSPSLDHVVPLSEGGEHTYANCRISHLRCNVTRSDRGGGEQLALFG